MCGNGLFLLSALSIYLRTWDLAGKGGAASTLTSTFFDVTAFHNIQHCRCRRQFPLRHSLWLTAHTLCSNSNLTGASGRMSLPALPFRGFDRRILATTDVANNVWNASFSRAHTINTWTYNDYVTTHTQTHSLCALMFRPCIQRSSYSNSCAWTLLCERAEKFVSDDFDNRT